jgi:hypothetical protein
MVDPPPTTRRLAVAALAATLAAVAVAALYFEALAGGAGIVIMVFLVGLPIAFLHLFILALPLYVTLRERWALTWWRALTGGLLVGGAPVSVLLLVSRAPLEELTGILFLGLLPGGVGGMTFWLILGSAVCRAPRVESAHRAP